MQEVEKILQIEHNIWQLPRPNESRIVLSPYLPPQELIATALVLAFEGDHLLQTHLVKRGWDLPGGHIEPGESPAEAVRREALEEAGANLGPLHFLGYQQIRLLGPRPAEYNYGYPDSYQVFYWAHIESLDNFVPTSETYGPALFAPVDALALSWVQHHKEFYRAALAAATGQINASE